jgi:hypothetical protein
VALVTVGRPGWFTPTACGAVSWAGLAVAGGAAALARAPHAANDVLFAFAALAPIFGGATVWLLLDRSALSRPARVSLFHPISPLSYGM